MPSCSVKKVVLRSTLNFFLDRFIIDDECISTNASDSGLEYMGGVSASRKIIFRGQYLYERHGWLLGASRSLAILVLAVEAIWTSSKQQKIDVVKIRSVLADLTNEHAHNLLTASTYVGTLTSSPIGCPGALLALLLAPSCPRYPSHANKDSIKGIGNEMMVLWRKSIKITRPTSSSGVQSLSQLPAVLAKRSLILSPQSWIPTGSLGHSIGP
jgi:hypothetical protein